MTRFPTPVLPLLVLAALTGCSDGSGPGPEPVVSCDEVEPTALAPGALALVDAARIACVRLPEAGAEGADYLYLAYSAAGEETRGGTSVDYLLTAATGGPPPPAAARPSGRVVPAPGSPVRRFHDRLRAQGQELARDRHVPRASARVAPSALAVPPVLGQQRTFNVLRSAEATGTKPADFVQVKSTARYVGSHIAIFVDDSAPASGGYTQGDLGEIGGLFDDHLHPLGVSAFGAETDVNGDGVVLVLLTDRVTRLAGCAGGQVVVGLFFAVDLFRNLVGSNNAEIFYGLVPDEACGVDRDRAIELLPSVFIHEFQHMINYGQHVIQRSGDAEDTWLDEGLSGFAEELGGRLVPDDRCVNADCLTQFHAGNLINAYDYLAVVGDAALIGPRRPPLPLTQYGATWLFVRWAADHFATEQPLGTDLTRSLVQTTRTGAENVAAATDTPFDRLIGEWQLANYLEGHPEPGDLAAGTRLEYTSWSLGDVFAAFHQEDPERFPRAYPLEADVFDGADYHRTGTLRAGSGQHLTVHQPAAESVDLRLTSPDGTTALPAGAVPRAAILRLR